MISLRKLSSLPQSTRQRKILKIITEVEARLAEGEVLDESFFYDCIRLLQQDGLSLPGKDTQGRNLSLQHLCNRWKHQLRVSLHVCTAEWDFISSPVKDRKKPLQRHPVSIFLDGVRSPFNVGSLLRSAEAFGVEKMLVSMDTVSPDHPRARRSSMGASTYIPWERMEYAELAAKEGVFALETGGIPLESFRFPLRGIAILGSEELGVSPELLANLRVDARVVSIPLFGRKASLNVGVAGGILLQAWTMYIQNRQNSIEQS